MAKLERKTEITLPLPEQKFRRFADLRSGLRCGHNGSAIWKSTERHCQGGGASYSNQDGQHEFPKLLAGFYALRIARPLQFLPYQRDAVKIDGATALRTRLRRFHRIDQLTRGITTQPVP
jgi:hypothetical protein